jgi:hypothetical protein
MSRTVKKKISSMSYSLNKLYRTVSTTKPSTLILSIIAIGIAIFLFGGGLYDLTMKPYPAVYSGTRFILVDPRLSEQFISDSIVATILYSLGVIGLLVIYQSTKYAYKPRQAYMMFIVGVVLLLLAYIFLEAAIQQKIG